jgi:putative endonuclease
MPYYVYILASGRNGTLYIGSTNDLIRRVWEHKNHVIPSFTKRYQVTHLVYYECYEDIGLANQREKNLKHWYRKWKLDLIESKNPDWNDLFESICA